MKLGGITNYAFVLWDESFFLFLRGGLMIRLENISKTFYIENKKVEAVKNVNLNIHKGEILGIIGFSGAGKSTLVRCINLLERPTTGKVWINDVDIMTLSQKELRKQRQNIGMIFQHFNLMPSRTVYSNIALAMKHSKLSKQEKETKIIKLLKLVGLEDKRHAYPRELSGGQKQRVAIARALANDPEILLCDEATSALDPQTTASILKLLKEINEQMGITMILITHEMAVVKEICDRVVVMEQGEVKEEGSIYDVFLHPQAPITKNFIETTSKMNKIQELLDTKHPLFKVSADDKMILLTYTKQIAGEAVISTISRDFNVNANIIYGQIEMLKDSSLGKLVIVLSGEKENISKAIDYIKSKDIQVEEVQSC